MSDDIRSRQQRKKQQREQATNKKNKKGNHSLLKKIIKYMAIALGALSVAGAIVLFSIILSAPDLDEESLTLAQNPEIYDRNDELISTLNTAENRRSANIDEVPELVQDAFVVTEDIRFYDHFGLDMRRIGGAIVSNVTGGFGSEGASTITQQVVRNLFLSADKTMTRKIQEQYLAVRLEQQYSKEQILEMYLNAIYFSDGRYGIVEAADYYFNKTLDELEIEDAALLAGMPQRPNAYNPMKNPDLAEQRRNTVISLMANHERISEEEAEQARNVLVEDQIHEGERETSDYQAFIDEVLDEVEALEEVDAQDIYSGGLEIYTTMDRDVQSHVEYLMQSGEVIQFPDDEYQAGITLMDTNSGAIRALGGHRETAKGARSWNWATSPKRQPGSTIKPVLDYGPAIDELQWSTFYQITDEPFQFPSGHEVRNFDRQYRGDVSMREALRDSLNVPAAKTFQEVGATNAQAFAERLGIPFDQAATPSYSLGGFSTGFSSRELAGAYAAFGNEGVYNEPYTVRKVVLQDGTEIDMQPEPEVAMNDYTAFMITDMLKTVVTSGTGTRANVSGVPIAGKTGSTNFSDEERNQYGITSGIRDSWFAGYSTDLTAAVWTGYNSLDEGYIQYDGHQQHIARDLFREAMTFAHQGLETSNFTRPDSVTRVAVERSTGKLPSEFTPESEIVHEYFVRGTEPTEVSDEFESLNPVSDLEAVYDEEIHEVIISWDYDEEFIDQVSFMVEARRDDKDEFDLLDITSSTSFGITNPELGDVYEIQITAISNEDEDLQSDASTTSVTIPEADELDEENMDEDLLDEFFDDLFGDDDDNQGNGPPANRPGNGHGNGNGNGHDQDPEDVDEQEDSDDDTENEEGLDDDETDEEDDSNEDDILNLT
ncbi:transglycosylase domain-containing protein [Texcoconibacillus texcoconensis]|uniref:Penicillin-binding protein 1A n=1 Tax=Texcoconibacillus texcoconensis TaxID=1095777 RepID=A0A840QQH9_9BACI|nr:PBP1A family penicillin-binding protein [Texcoconibacillus texcoconensis]MBB5173591.1 penicillin-binding protein 1A [Texcoconibacillus texcoconensis]